MIKLFENTRESLQLDMKERMLVEDIKLLAIKNKGWQLDFTKFKKKNSHQKHCNSIKKI